MIAFASSTVGGNRRLAEWDPRNLCINFNTRLDLFTPRPGGEWWRNKKMLTLVRSVSAICMDPFMESARIATEISVDAIFSWRLLFMSFMLSKVSFDVVETEVV